MPQRGARTYSTPQDVLEYQEKAREVAQQLLINQLPDVSSAEAVQVREAIAGEDLDGNDVTATSAAVDTASPVWETTGQTGEGWTGWYAVDSDGSADDKGVVIWGFQDLTEDETAALPFSALRAKNNTGGLIDLIDLASIDQSDNGILLLDNPIKLGTNDVFFEIYQSDDSDLSTNDPYQIKPLVTVAEESGNTLESSSRFIRS